MSFGAGVVITAALILGTFFWYESRPKPWNSTAIAAIYNSIDTEGEKNTFVFYYTLENNTDFDYKISFLSDVVLLAKLKRGDSLSGKINDKFFQPDYRILLPARQRIRFAIHLGYPYVYDIPRKEDATDEEKEKYRNELKAYASKKFSNLNGFVIFDEKHRYQINFPKGW